MKFRDHFKEQLKDTEFRREKEHITRWLRLLTHQDIEG